MNVPAENMNSVVTLRELLAGIAEAPAIPVSGISADSRHLQTGDVFLACQGAASHGLDYIDQAVGSGVAAIVWDTSTGSDVSSPVPMIPVIGLSRQLGEIANRWFDYPSRDVRVIGVTGTNGKTTVAYLLQQCLTRLGRKCGYTGTLGSGFNDIRGDDVLTTPPCVELHEQLAEFRDQAARFAAIEVSSHALEQQRVDGVQFDAAIFTNLSRDHIDYHGDMRRYFETKASLFLEHTVPHRIVNVDSEFGAELATRCGKDVVTVSTNSNRDVEGARFVSVRTTAMSATASTIAASTAWGDITFRLPLPADFNVANAAQVLALLLSLDVPIDDAREVLSQVSAPPGRMQPVSVDTECDLPAVVVDYSHTPASLEVALKSLRAHCNGKLWCVFGCGGDRDRGKRPMMGEVASRLSDQLVVTNDNPRTETPAAIIADITAGLPEGITTIENRRDAIAHAIDIADTTDTILIAGKGHEDYQIIGTQKSHFSDYDVAFEKLIERSEAGS